MKNLFMAIMLCLAACGCVSMSTDDRNKYRRLGENGISIERPVGKYEAPKSALVAGLLNLVLGAGNFYLASGEGGESTQAAYGALNLLSWPFSILWAVPQGVIDATTLNKKDMVYYYTCSKKGRKELEKLDIKLDDEE